MKKIPLDDVKIHEPIYPRVDTDQGTVKDYVEAIESGAEFPPIEIQQGTGFLLDGAHRLEAHRVAGADKIAVVEVDPENPLEYAIEANYRHGKQLTRLDKQRAMRLLAEADPDFVVTDVAKKLAVNPSTVERHLAPQLAARVKQAEHDQTVRRCLSHALARAGMTQTAIGDLTGTLRQTVANDLQKQDLCAALGDAGVVADVLARAETLDVLDEATDWVASEMDFTPEYAARLSDGEPAADVMRDWRQEQKDEAVAVQILSQGLAEHVRYFMFEMKEHAVRRDSILKYDAATVSVPPMGNGDPFDLDADQLDKLVEITTDLRDIWRTER
jgi:hypothetical protein